MRFHKVHGLGNDFILFDHTQGETLDYNAVAKSLCHRQTGIGADGILAVLPSDQADIRMRIINSDGSEAEMCGNGIRAFSKYVYEAGLVKKPAFSIETLAGIMRPSLTIADGKVAGVTVDMGEPFLQCSEIPVEGEGRCIDRALTVLGQTVRYTSVLVGVPHTVVFVPDPTAKGLMELGDAIEHAAVFPKRTNVNFVHIIDNKNVEMRTWERGCGPTLACGTGACSAIVACVLNGKTQRSANVHLALGTLHIQWAEDDHVYMTGPAEIVYTGEVAI